MTKLAELTADQLEARRKYDRERKQAAREKVRVEQERQEPKEYDDAIEAYWASPDCKQVDQFINDTIRKIYDELQPPENFKFCTVDEALDRVLTLHYCFEHNLSQQSFHGPIYGYWAEVSGEDIVRWRHQCDLCRSKIFSDIYWPLIRKLDKLFSSYLTSKDAVYQISAQAIKDELNGCYQYPVPAPVVKVEPKVDPPAPPEPDDLDKVLAAKKKQLENDVERYSQINRFVGSDALKYLDGGFR